MASCDLRRAARRAALGLLVVLALAPLAAAQEPQAVLDGAIVKVRSGSSVVWPNSAGQGGYLVLKPDGAPMMVEPGNVSQSGARNVHGLTLWLAEGSGDVTLKVLNNSGLAALAMPPFYLGGVSRAHDDFNSTTPLRVPAKSCQLHWMRAPTTGSTHAFWVRASGEGLRFRGYGEDLTVGEENVGHHNTTVDVAKVDRWFLMACNDGPAAREGTIRTAGEPAQPEGMAREPPEVRTPLPAVLALAGLAAAGLLRRRAA